MNYRKMILRRARGLAGPLIAVLSLSLVSSTGGGLEEVFRHPPESAKPWAYWFWINGNITKKASRRTWRLWRGWASAAC